MKRHPKIFHLIFSFVFLFAQAAWAQQYITGSVTDAETEDALISASIQIADSDIATVTDSDGSFKLTGVPEGSHTLIVRYLGYQTKEQQVDIVSGETKELQIELQPAGLEFDDLIITASPTGSNVTYQPTRSFNEEEMQRRAANSFGEMLDGEPGVAMRSFGPAPSRPVIRGFGDDRILVLENGERMGDLSETAHDHNIALEPEATERLEVVRGPAGLLYGSNALGGVVNLITQDIPQDWSRGSSGTASLRGASVNTMGSGFGRYQYGGENWATGARISYRRAGNLHTPQGELPGTGINNVEGAIGSAFHRDTFTGGFALMAMDNVFGVPEEIDNPDEEVEIRMNRQAMQGRGQWETNSFFDEGELRLHTSRFFQQEVEMEFENGGLDEEEIELEFLQHSISSTLTLQHRPVGMLDRGAVGLSVNHRNLDVGGLEAFTPGVSDGSAALFTFQEAPLTDVFTAQAGIRVEQEWLNTLANEFFPETDEQRRSTNLSGAAGINYRPSEFLEIGSQFARAHRTPTLEELFADGPHLGIGAFEIGDPDLRDEIGHGLDLFVRWTGTRFAGEVAGYTNHLSNFIIFQPTGETDEDSELPIYKYEAENALISGFEADFKMRVTDELILNLGADYVHGHRLDEENTPLPNMPPLRAILGLDYDIERWWVGVKSRLVSAQNRVAEGESGTDGYTLLDVDAGYRLDQGGRHLLTLRIDNLFNVTYRDHLSRVEERRYTMPARNFNLGWKWRF